MDSPETNFERKKCARSEYPTVCIEDVRTVR